MKAKLILPFLFLTHFANAQGIWTQKANFGGAKRQYSTGFSLMSKGYIGTGGFMDSIWGTWIYLKDFWEYDPITNVWTQKADFGGAERLGAVGFSIGNKGYIGTGDGAGNYYSDFWEYDPLTNIWIQKADFGGMQRTRAIGFAIGNKGYIGTGMDSVPAFRNDFWEYNPSSNVWTQKTNFGSSGRWYAAGFSIGSKGYIGTGKSSSSDYNQDFWEYDTTLNAWTQKANFGGNGRYMAAGFSVGSNGYIGIGWIISNGYTKDIWEYNPTLNTWTQKANIGGNDRRSAVSFSINNRGYIGTGEVPGDPSNDFWEYCDTCSFLSINELNNAINILLFPNPSYGIFTIKTETGEITDLKTYNMFGEMIYQSTNLPAHQSTIDLSSSPSGIYFLHIKTTEGVAVKKIIKQ